MYCIINNKGVLLVVDTRGSHLLVFGETAAFRRIRLPLTNAAFRCSSLTPPTITLKEN